VRLDAVRQIPLTKRARNAEIEDIIKDWLRTASSRCGSKLSHSGSVTSIANYAVSERLSARYSDTSQEDDSTIDVVN
jgi:hypothetical protein